MSELPEVVAYSPRLLLCRPTPCDEDAVRGLRQDTRVMHYLGGPAADRVTAERFAQDLAHWDQHGYGKCIVLDKVSRNFVGYCGLQIFEGDPDLGYLLAPGWWGRGLATECARAVLWHGFEYQQLRLIRALTHVTNRASQRVLTKAGMRYLRDRVLWGDRQRCYAVTAMEWAARISS